MGENELRAVGESIKVGDKIRIGILDTDLTVEDRPIEESGGSLIFSASRPNYPEEGIVTYFNRFTNCTQLIFTHIRVYHHT